jgi:hypothetical protein
VSQSELFEDLGKSTLNWFWDGYSASIVTFGQSQTGKTYSLFGAGKSETRLEDQGLFNMMAYELFQRIQKSDHPESFKVGISCWDVFKNGIHYDRYTSVRW